MAGEPSAQQCNIQDIVRVVVDNFNSLPPPLVLDELNCCFQISHGAQNFQPHVESQPNSMPTASTNTNDSNRRYRQFKIITMVCKLHVDKKKTNTAFLGSLWYY